MIVVNEGWNSANHNAMSMTELVFILWAADVLELRVLIMERSHVKTIRLQLALHDSFTWDGDVLVDRINDFDLAVVEEHSWVCFLIQLSDRDQPVIAGVYGQCMLAHTCVCVLGNWCHV